MTNGERPATLRPSVGFDMLPPGLSFRDRFQLAVDAGFEGTEVDSVENPDEADEIREAAIAAGLSIHSVKTHANWQFPLSDPNPAVVARGIRAVTMAMANARLWGADTVLLVPGLVTTQTSYADAYHRSQNVIRKELVPRAKEFEITLGVENVWNGFLLSPLEYVRYIDEIDSEHVRAYLDVGNMIFGHSEHWVRIAGPRIVKLHAKDFRFNPRAGTFTWAKIGNGDLDWPAIRASLEDVRFAGWVTNTGGPLGGTPVELVRKVLARLDGPRTRWMSRQFTHLPSTRAAYLRLLRDVYARFLKFRGETERSSIPP